MDKSKHTVTIPVDDYETMIRSKYLLEKIFRIAKHAEAELEKIAEGSDLERAKVSETSLYKILGRIPSD